jgi:pimeloyl-ACP methyl ester carboxylesterase
MGRLRAAISSFTGNGRSPGRLRYRPTVVIAHGAWTDGSTWSDVISRLQANDVTVIAAHISLASLFGDVAMLERELAACEYPVILVGHGWGGTVITQVGDDAKVAALVYVAAFAPKSGESTNDLNLTRPIPPYVSIIQIDAAGFLRIPQEFFADHMAQDLGTEHARVLAATQAPIRGGALDDRVTVNAWSAKPSWYLIAEADRMIDPGLQREMARRMHAKTITVRSSHVPFITRPRETTALVLEAVKHVRQ